MIGVVIFLGFLTHGVDTVRWDSLPGMARRDSLPEVTVRGYRDGGSQSGAIRLQKASGLIVDIIPEEDIQRSSDLTIADVTRRINGLSVTTDNSGQTSHTIIRGMDPKYNYTLIDGIKIPTPGDRSRYIPLSIFPADMVQRVEVYKSLMPAMEGDAIGGVVNMALRNAPGTPLLRVRLASGYNQTFFDQSYRRFDRAGVRSKSPYELHGPEYYARGADFTRSNLSFRSVKPLPDALGSVVWGQRYFHQRLGVLVAGEYQDVRRGTSGFFIPQNNEPGLNNTPGLTDFYRSNFSTTLIRESVHARLDWVFDPGNSIGLYQLYVSQRDIESRSRVDTSLSLGRTVPATGRVTLSDRSRMHLQHIYGTSIRGEHQLGGGLSFRWVAARAVATGLYPDWSEFSVGTARLEGPGGVISSTPLLLNGMTRSWLSNRERDLSIYGDWDYHRFLGPGKLALTFGGMYRDKRRDNFYNSYDFQPAVTTSQGQPFTDIDHAEWTNNNGPLNPLGSAANPNTYTANEHIGAGYIAASWKGRRVEYVAGVRYEDTRQRFVSSVDPTVSYGKEGSIRYRDWLPSVSFKFGLGEARGDSPGDPRQLLRASWYRSISRPALYDVTFYSVEYEDYREAGNPFLRRSHADNIDLRYEWYPGGLDILQAGVFYKHITDAYERTLLNANDELYPLPSQGLAYTRAGQLTAQMRNAGPVNDYGFEIAAAHYFHRLGVQMGYTYTYSRIVQAAKFKTRQDVNDPSSDIVTVTRDESRPLQGQSPHLGSLSLSYQQSGWSGRISAIYTGRRIYSVSGWYGLAYWQRGYTTLDVSLEKALGRRVKVFAKASNLFNTTTTVDLLRANPDFVSRLIPGQERGDRITVMKQVDRAVYYVGVQWGVNK